MNICKKNNLMNMRINTLSQMKETQGKTVRHGFAALLPAVLLSATMFLGGCAKEMELEVGDNGSAKGTLAVTTRSVDGTVSYPVSVYVFGSTGSCAAMATLSSADDELSVYLSKDNYTVQAVGGASADDYILPTKEEAASNSPITLRDGHSHGDLMTAAQMLAKVGENETNELTLTMTRKVMQLCSVKINSVPSEVTAVSVSISPLYGTLLLDGTCTGTNGAYTANLTKEADGTTWTLESGAYLLEASGKASITVAMTTAEGTKTFAYESSNELKANYKINITGTYKQGGFTVNGTVTGTEWAGVRDIVFKMTDSQDSDDKGGTATSIAPEVGSIYMKKCYVLRNDTNKVTGTITSTLMTIDEKSGLTNTKEHTNDEWKELTDAGLAEMAVEGVPEWRLPTHEELMAMITVADADKDDKLWNLFINAGGSAFKTAMYVYYFYLTDDGQIMQIDYRDLPIEPDANTKLRGFTTVTFK